MSTIIQSGADYSYRTITSKQIIISTGGSAFNNNINADGILTVNDGGTASNNTINSGGILTINDGGTASNTTINSNGNLIINSGGAVFNNIINSGTLDIRYGGEYYGSGFGSNGGCLVLNSGIEWNKSALEEINALGSNMHYIVNSATSYNNATIGSEGGLSVQSGGLAFNDTIDGGILQIGSGAVLFQTSFTSNGGTLILDSGFVGTTSNLQNLDINSNVSVVVQSNAALLSRSFLNTDVFINSIGSAVGNIFSGGSFRVHRGYVSNNTFINTYIGITSGAAVVNNVLSNTDVSVDYYNRIASNTLEDGTFIRVGYIGTALSNIVNAGATIQVSGTQAGARGNIINNEGHLIIGDRSMVYENITTSGAFVDITGGLTEKNSFTDTTINIQEGGLTPNFVDNIIQGGILNANDGLIGRNDFNHVSISISSRVNMGNNSITSSFITINDEYTVFGNNSISASQVNVFSGIVDNNIFYSGSLLNVYSGGSLEDNTIISSGASAVLHDGAILDGTLTLNSGGYAEITTSTGGTISLTDNSTPIYLLDGATKLTDTNTGLVIYGLGSATTVINGFTGAASDHITLANVQTSNVAHVEYPDVNHVTFTLNNGSTITLNIAGVGNYGYELGSDANGNVIYEVCFLTGTMIETPSGACAVEDLYVGDLVLVYDPVTQTKISAPITWVGHKKVSVNPNRLNDEAGYPVRILKDAIAENVPNKDLLITPEHCLFFDGKFVPARMLVNGYSIFYDTTMTSYEYYHIETKNHSILTADGMLTESYLDTGNRHVFNQGQKVIELSGDNVKTWEQDAIAPLATEVSIVEPIYNNILQRATQNECVKQSQFFEVTQDPDLYLMTDQGQIIHKKANSTDKKVSFIIPNDVDAVWIMSRTSRPCDVIGSYVDDRRYLGVLVGDINLQRNGKKQNITAHIEADQLLGWDVKEAVSCRWTKGKALLPLNVKSRSNMPTTLTLTILSDHSYVVDYDKNNKKLA